MTIINNNTDNVRWFRKLIDNFNIIFTYHEQENSLHLPTNDFIMDFFVMKLSSTFSCHYTRIQRRLD